MLQIITKKKTQNILLFEKPRSRPKAIPIIADKAQKHYLSEIVSQSLLNLGFKRSSKLRKYYYPTDKKTRSGELGEILATEFVNSKLAFQVPILKLRWKDGRQLAMRGDDFIALRVSQKKLVFIKGESKSRAKMNSATLQSAVTALRRNRGRPSAHSLGFIMSRLFENNQPALAKLVSKHLLSDDENTVTHHLVFTFSENDPQNLIAALKPTKGRWTAFVSLVTPKHQQLIKQVYKALI